MYRGRLYPGYPTGRSHSCCNHFPHEVLIHLVIHRGRPPCCLLCWCPATGPAAVPEGQVDESSAAQLGRSWLSRVQEAHGLCERPVVMLISVSLRVVLSTHVYRKVTKKQFWGGPRSAAIFASLHIGKRPSKENARASSQWPLPSCILALGRHEAALDSLEGREDCWLSMPFGARRVAAATVEETTQEAAGTCNFPCARERAPCSFT